MLRTRVRNNLRSVLDRLRPPKPTADPAYPPLAQLVDAYGSAGSAPQVLYFGDSVLVRVAQQDRDRRLLHEMLQDRIGRPVCGIRHGAFHPGVYRSLIRCLGRLPRRPKTVIVPVNLRCFSPQWDLDPAYQFSSELELLEQFAGGTGETVPSFRESAPSQDLYEPYDRTPVTVPGSALASVGQFRLVIDATPQTQEQTRFREQQIFGFFYMVPLERDHRRVLALVELLQMLRTLGIRPLVYATPINVGAAREVLGEPFSNQVRKNVATLAGALGERLLDWSEALQPEHFFHGKLHTEHLNEHGRARLVELVAGALVTQ